MKSILLHTITEITPRNLQSPQTEELANLKSFVLSATEFLNDAHEIPYTMASRVYAVLNDITEIPKCACGNLCPPDRKSKGWGYGFAKSCSTLCSKKRTRIGDAAQLLASYDWVFDQRIIQKKSHKTIAKELGISHTPVYDAIRKLNIPEIILTESRPEVKMLLRDKEFLIKKHKEERLTCEQIAELIGSSKSSVSIALSKAGIITNESNSYDRKIVKNSKWQSELVEYIKTIYSGEIKTNKRGIIGSQELDIYLPEIKYAIECNGVFYHQYQPHQEKESAKKGIYYHVNKTKACEQLGITLLHFFDLTWKQKPEIIKSMIASRIGVSSNKIYARNCSIRDLTTHEKHLFLDKNHLQGRDRSLLYYGLFNNEILVSVMTFGRSRFNKKYDWELMRFCQLLNHNIVGGFSKLLNHFRKQHNGSIISYADRMYSVGNVYKKNGFVLSHINRPSYYYIDFNKEQLLHRSNFRKKNIQATDCTEEEKMRELGYGKIFDCGNYAYVLI